MRQKQFKDYYVILNLPRNASSAQIKRAYRELALVHHPDHAGTGGAEKFILIKEAYDVFSNKDKKEEYDRELALRDRRKTGVLPGGPAHHDLSFVKERIKKRAPLNDFTPMPPPKVTLEKNQCPACSGHGLLRDKYGLLRNCGLCKGTGRKKK
ncbi:MAG: DnaJ domain-containing protein [Nitrospinae bacterium]|nr:DnaJ domain-containing protein [Nitrospinota bacterium]